MLFVVFRGSHFNVLLPLCAAAECAHHHAKAGLPLRAAAPPKTPRAQYPVSQVLMGAADGCRAKISSDAGPASTFLSPPTTCKARSHAGAKLAIAP